MAKGAALKQLLRVQPEATLRCGGAATRVVISEKPSRWRTGRMYSQRTDQLIRRSRDWPVHNPLTTPEDACGKSAGAVSHRLG